MDCPIIYNTVLAKSLFMFIPFTFHVCLFLGLPETGKSIATGAVGGKQPVAAGVVEDADADLEARLDNLRRQ